MKLIYYFVLGSIVIIFGSILSNDLKLKSLKYYKLIGILLGIINTYIWFSIAKLSKNSTEVLLNGFYWNCLFILIGAIIPIYFYKAVLTNNMIIGSMFIIVGIIFTKL